MKSFGYRQCYQTIISHQYVLVPFVSQDPGGASFVLLGPGTENRPRRIYKIEPRFRHWHNHV